MSAYILDVAELYRRLQDKRHSHGLSWRQIASRLDISASTFSRIADGGRPDADTLVSLLTWLDIDIACVTKPNTTD